MLVSFFRSSGYVARPDCLSTFDFDGAVSSLSTVHFGSPDPVRVAVQPSGTTPIRVLSKLIAWFDMSFTPRRKSVAAIMALRRCGSGMYRKTRGFTALLARQEGLPARGAVQLSLSPLRVAQ